MDLRSNALVVNLWVQLTCASNFSSKSSWTALLIIMRWEELEYIWLHPLYEEE